MSDLVDMSEDEADVIRRRRAVRGLFAEALGRSVPDFAALKATVIQRGGSVESQECGPLGGLPKTDQLQAILPVLFGMGEELAEAVIKDRADGEHEEADALNTEVRYIWETAAFVASAVRTNRQIEQEEDAAGSRTGERVAVDGDPQPEF